MGKEEEIKICRAQKEDAVSIDIILSTYFLDRDEIPYEDFYIARAGEKVVGCAVFEKIKARNEDLGFYEIHTIAVLPAYRNKGIGKFLLNRLITEIENRISSESKTLKTIYTRTTAPDFFEHIGFEKATPDKTELWEECFLCNKIEICSQTVLIKNIET
ncbi:MAG: GNAT family N-acetyltransferase [Methanimicrococcus sp.]|nr:GNAT family N-acetyltransferase [Methanimicrococcus sp.]